MSAELILQNIARRRSIRSFRKEQVKEADLQAILDAGRAAPSGGRHNTTHLLVIQNQSVLQELQKVAEKELAKMEEQPDTYRGLRTAIRASKRGGYEFLYQAPTLIVAANEKSHSNAMADTICVVENMFLAATALEVGSCYINHFHWLTDSEPVREVLERLGLKPYEQICAGMVLGYPAGRDVFYPVELHGNPVTYVR